MNLCQKYSLAWKNGFWFNQRARRKNYRILKCFSFSVFKGKLWNVRCHSLKCQKDSNLETFLNLIFHGKNKFKLVFRSWISFGMNIYNNLFKYKVKLKLYTSHEKLKFCLTGVDSLYTKLTFLYKLTQILRNSVHKKSYKVSENRYPLGKAFARENAK